MKFTSAPTAPKASGVMPKLFGPPIRFTNSVPLMKKMPLCANTVNSVTPRPASMPRIAPSRFMPC